MGLVIAVLSYSALGVLAFSYSDTIIFHPPKVTYHDDKNILKIKTLSGKHISAISMPNPHSKYTILYSHGNAEDLGTVVHRLKELYDLGFSVIGYDYEGYGTSEGTPSEKNTYEDIDAVYMYLINDLRISTETIISYGFSLGGAVATDLASRKNIGGVILESTFVSAFRVLTKYSIMPYDKYRSLDKIRKVKCPILVMHGGNDQVVPFWHGKKLFEAAPFRKRNLWVEKAGHGTIDTVDGGAYRKAIIEFTSILGDK